MQQAMHDNARAYAIQANSLEQDALKALFAVNAGGLVALAGYLGSTAFAGELRFGGTRVALLLVLLGTGRAMAVMGAIFKGLGHQGREVQCEEFAFWLAEDQPQADPGLRVRARDLVESTGRSSTAAAMSSLGCFLAAIYIAADAFSPLFSLLAGLLR